MNRLSLYLFNGKIASAEVKIGLETYFAFTSNTLQFGAKVGFSIVKGRLAIIGLFGFDVLFQFKPFKFNASVYAMVSIVYRDEELFAIALDFNLEGPGPWHAFGKAKFKIGPVGFKTEFDKSWGKGQTSALQPVDLETKVIDDFKEEANWISELPNNRDSQVQIKEFSDGDIVLDPLGSLTVTQKIAPLGVSITQYGPDPVIHPGKYEVEEIILNPGTNDEKKFNATQNTADFLESREDFAPAQFKKMSDDKKLKAASFEYLQSGKKISSDELRTGGYVPIVVDYDRVVIDTEHRENVLTTMASAYPEIMVNAVVGGGLISSNPLSIKQNNLVTNNNVMIKVDQEAKSMVLADDLSVVSTVQSYAEALDAQEEALLGANAYEFVPV